MHLAPAGKMGSCNCGMDSPFWLTRNAGASEKVAQARSSDDPATWGRLRRAESRRDRARTDWRAPPHSSFSAISSNFRTVFQLRLVPEVRSVFSTRGSDSFGRPMPLG